MDPALEQDMRHAVSTALAEDVGSGDLTAALIPEQARCSARVVSREPGVLCGGPWFCEVFAQLDGTVVVEWGVHEGSPILPGQALCRIVGPARSVLTGERTALNFLQTLSATATRTREFVDRVSGTGATILDTRKTLPGLRRAQKYAVRCGGGTNHRMGLYDGILIKENHIAAAGSIAAAVARARDLHPATTVEVETEDLSQVEAALEAGADIVMLDNFGPEQMRAAVALNRGRARLEASGGVTLETVRAIAETGVDCISVGALTKHIRAVDLSLRLE